MLDVLSRVESALPELLRDESAWTGLMIDYHPPFVERLWLGWEGYRINLHRIHPCLASEALFHPHPWPSAMVILEGRYEMAIGFGSGDVDPPRAARIIAPAGLRYEMTERDAWHYVRPLDAPVVTLMVTGAPWDRSAPSASKPLGALSADKRRALFEAIEKHYFQASAREAAGT